MRIVALILALVVVGGCVTKSTTTEGDREVLHQTVGAVDQAAAAVDQARAAATEGSESWTLLGVSLRALRDAKLNVDQQLEVHGSPEKPMPYTAENSTAAREKSKKEHAGTPWGTYAMGALGVIVGAAGAFIGCPWLGRLFPVLTGSAGKLAQAGVDAISRIRTKAEETGGKIEIRDLLGILKDEQVRAGVKDLAAGMAKKTEEKFDTVHEVTLDGPDPIAPLPAAPTH